jgi:hypothetical protein
MTPRQPARGTRPRGRRRRKSGVAIDFGVESLALLANRVSIFVQLLETAASETGAAGLGKDSERNISPEGFFEK